MIEKDTNQSYTPPEIKTGINFVLDEMRHLLDNIKSFEKSGLISPNISEKHQDKVISDCHNCIFENIIMPYSKYICNFESNTSIPRESFDYDVFICHSSKDNSSVKLIIDKFTEEKISYWVDSEQIDFGDSVIQKIEEGLQKSKCIMPCLSKNLTKSGWTRAEYTSILNAEFSGNSCCKIIPLRLDDCDDDDIPPLLRDKKRVNYTNEDEFTNFLKFLKDIRSPKK